ncbi:MAG: YcgN family cysteine cluster protein [Gammaproteobacteria bacterium]
MNSAFSEPFWRRKRLEQMSRTEWEALCDGCGKCCLLKLEDEDGTVAHTNAACRLLDLATCRCRHYPQRRYWVPDCISLTPEKISTLPWLPITCAYRLIHEGKDLPSWHPLVSGDPNSVHEAGVSIRSWAVSERQVRRIEDHIIDWQP